MPSSLQQKAEGLALGLVCLNPCAARAPAGQGHGWGCGRGLMPAAPPHAESGEEDVVLRNQCQTRNTNLSTSYKCCLGFLAWVTWTSSRASQRRRSQSLAAAVVAASFLEEHASQA
eukprot:scaffold160771_cov28-Tisochrysis_lutea.AAC.1